jgi:hypothetical protein
LRGIPAVVERVFGQIKQARGFRQSLLRGLDKAAGEHSLLCTAHNLLKYLRLCGKEYTETPQSRFPRQ